MKTLATQRGTVRFPTFLPVTTFGSKYPLDALVRPYLPRLSQAAMVSLHYARQRTVETLPIPIFVDSGGFASLFSHATIVERSGLGILRLQTEDGLEETTPEQVLRFQEDRADIASTLDFPIPPGTETSEAERRQALTVANAVWAIENRRRPSLPLYACIQSWDVPSARSCTRQLARYPFEGFAIGGLVPRAGNPELLERIVRTVRDEVGDRPLHVFGLGKPDLIRNLLRWGADSTDSSSYLKLAADGKAWDSTSYADPSPLERMSLALRNIQIANEAVASALAVP